MTNQGVLGSGAFGVVKKVKFKKDDVVLYQAQKNSEIYYTKKYGLDDVDVLKNIKLEHDNLQFMKNKNDLSENVLELNFCVITHSKKYLRKDRKFKWNSVSTWGRPSGGKITIQFYTAIFTADLESFEFENYFMNFNFFERVEIYKRIFSGVGYIHHHNKIIGDIKPRNMMFLEDPEGASNLDKIDKIKIIDLGSIVEMLYPIGQHTDGFTSMEY